MLRPRPFLQLTLDHHVPEAPAHNCGLRLHPFGVQVVQLQDPALGSRYGMVLLHRQGGHPGPVGFAHRRVFGYLREVPLAAEEEDHGLYSSRN